MPVDIVISVMEEEKVVPVQEKIEQKPTLELVVKAKPIEKPEPAPIQEKKITPEISLPGIRVIPEIKKRPKVTQPVVLKNPIQEEKITLEIPLPNIREIHEIENREIENRPKVTQSAASKSSSFDKTTQDKGIIKISGSVVPKRHYKINRVARKFRAKQSDFISNSFSKQPDTPAVIISQANSSKKKYTIDTSNRRIPTPSDKISGSNVISSSQSVKSNNVTLPETNQINEQYSLAKHSGISQWSPLSQTDNQSLSFAHQNKEELLTLTPLINAKSVSKKSRPIQGDLTGGEQAPDFSSAMTGEIDPSYLINLKKFSVCADPEEEFRLKTELAARLDGPSKFGKNGIIFFFKYTETGYTIDIDIYNPQGERFQDRCSVLHLAIESIENTKK
ncbi:MAG: hypothetical protein LWW98_01625 [Deltaproteobacteria bacterium]|nr:hypothetical protein [Deltaproteobacteria bacterium]